MIKSCFIFALVAGLTSADMCCQAMTSDCRACSKGLSVADYCFACVYQGMNDAGCYDCPRTVTRQTPSTVSQCQKQGQYAMSIPGRFTPQCNDDGSYAAMQCHGSTGYCWCVDTTTGQEIDNTRQAPGSIPNCARVGLTPCQLQASQASYGYGGFRPRCSSDGSYSPMQCHGSTGYCWCVDITGKEVDGSRVPPGTMANCTKTQTSTHVTQMTNCQWAVEDAAHVIGQFVPQCRGDGSYSPLQCHGSTGYCWCVDKDGTEIDGSRKGPGDMPACSVYSLSACVLQQSQTGHGIGAYRPQCEADGTFSKMQCHGSTGNCWCVDQLTGIEINNTRVGPGNMPNCDSVLRVTQCQAAVSAAAPVFGAFVPQCAEDGSYSALQCHGSTGYCWCVSGDGTEIPGTRKGPGIVVDCTTPAVLRVSAAAMTPCQSQAKQASTGYGSYHPQCESDGSFSRLQCHASTGYCWCVEQSTGKAIDSSRRGPGNVPDCDSFDGSSQQLSACELQVSSSSHLLGSYVPQCEQDGSYSSLQCHPSTGYCWCVDSNGQEITNTRKGPGRVVDCTAATLTPCQLQQKQASHGYGSFAPQCNSDGSYNRVQCHASTGYCWCVAVNGVEVNGTRVGPGNVPDCTAQQQQVLRASVKASVEASACEQQAASGAGTIGAFVPQCEQDGSFSALQCWSSTGECWCTNGTGTEFAGSRVRFNVPDCDMFLLSPCLLQRKQASPGFGSFRPRCEDDGSYSALQCHGSTGYCWCVSADGKEIANTRVGPGGAPTCASFKHSRTLLIAKALMP